MKRFLHILIILSLLLPIFIANWRVLAQEKLEVDYPDLPGTDTPESAKTPITTYFKYIYNWLIIIAGLLTFVLLVWGGIQYVFSSGMPALMADAKSQILNALLGLVVILASWLLLNTLNPRLLLLDLRDLKPIEETEIVIPELPEPENEEYVEVPVGTLITSEIGISSFLASTTATTTDPDCNCKNVDYDEAFSEVFDYPTKYQGGLHGRRLKRIHEVASTTRPVVDLLKEISGELTERVAELAEKNTELRNYAMECKCENCDARSEECIGDPCPNRDKMNKLREEIIPSYYEEEDDPIPCKIFEYKYFSHAFEPFLDNSSKLVKSEDAQTNSYWHSSEANDLRSKIEACIASGEITQEQYDKVEESINLMAEVENKGTHTSNTKPPERDVETNINHLEVIKLLLEGVKKILNPQHPLGCYPQAYSFQQKSTISDVYDVDIDERSLGSDMEGIDEVKVLEDPATFYCPLGILSDPEETFFLEDISYAQNCPQIIEIPVGKTIDEALQLMEDILRELKNIHKKGHLMVDKGEEQEKFSKEMFDKSDELIELTSEESCVMCEEGCEAVCTMVEYEVEVTDASGNTSTETRRKRECKCEGEPCPRGKINKVWNQILELEAKIKAAYEEISKSRDSIYESFYKLNSKNEETGEDAHIGKDLCCEDPEGICRDDNFKLEFREGKMEEREYTLKEKLFEIQKLLNRIRDSRDYEYLIRELVVMGFAEKESIDNIPDADHWADLKNCDVLLGQVRSEQLKGGIQQRALINCWLGGEYNYGILVPEKCSPDPPYNCDFFDDNVFPKKSYILCYCYHDSMYPETADNFFCCKGFK